MSVIYIKEQGSYVKKVDERLVVEKNKQHIADIPIHTITDVSIMGNVQVTTQALHLLMEEGIDISYFSYSGKYLGHIAADKSKNIFLRFAQYEMYQNIESRLDLARTIVNNKINNQLAIIRNYRWENDYSPQNEIDSIKRIQASIKDTKTANEIMGVEGSCSAVYFTAYGQMFKSEIKFEKRSRRPPKDPVNVILSLGYTFLTKEVASALEAESFETYLGFLHGIRYGRQSLALDIVEEFRQPIIDRLTLQLFNKHMISEIDFEKYDNRIVLTEDGFKKFCKAYEKWMVSESCSSDTRSFRNIIKKQISGLKASIKEHKEYIPYAWRADNVSS